MNGKRAVIFDFDDTLVHTNVVFERVKAAFAQEMAALGLADAELLPVLNRFDVENVRRHGGLAKECFPHALRQTYAEYCRRAGLPCDRLQAEIFENWGWSVFDAPVEPVEGAHEVLETLRRAGWTLFLLTQGDRQTQEKRLAAAGMNGYFHKYYITHAKSKADFLLPLAEYDLPATACWSVGNSIRADMNPALAVGLRAIHVCHECWDYEHAQPAGFFYQVERLADCLPILFQNEE